MRHKKMKMTMTGSKRKRANTGSIDENTFQRMSNDDKLGVIFQKLINNDNDNDNSLFSISGLRPIIQITFYYIIIISSTHDIFQIISNLYI